MLELSTPSAAQRPPGARSEPLMTTRWACSEGEVRAAQRLRHAVFVDELGARISPPSGTPPGHDADLFDPFCEHLLVGADDKVVGTYRLLTPDAARRCGGLYSELEFDLTRLRPQRPRMVEAGRACVHPDWRQGGTILALWSALADFMQSRGLDTMLGCASIGVRDGGHQAADLWHALAPIEHHVRPRMPLPVEELVTGRRPEPPALLKGYLRCGARLLGPPAWDPDFRTADLPLMLRLADLPARYRRHFLAG